MRGIAIVGLIGLLSACGEAGPSEAELAAKKTEKECSKVYGALTKVLKEELNKGGVGGVEFGEKPGFVELCVKAGFSDEQLKCMDPNRGGSDECKKALESKKDQSKELTEYLLAPMKKKAEEGKKEEKPE